MKKEQKLVLEAEEYYLDIVGVSSTKCRGSDTVELNESLKLFYSHVHVIMFTKAGLGIFVSPRLAHCVTDWIPLRKRVFLHKLRLQEGSLCILQVNASNAETQYHPFLDEVCVSLQKVKTAESILLQGAFIAHGRVLSEKKETPTLTERKMLPRVLCHQLTVHNE